MFTHQANEPQIVEIITSLVENNVFNILKLYLKHSDALNIIFNKLKLPQMTLSLYSEQSSRSDWRIC